MAKKPSEEDQTPRPFADEDALVRRLRELSWPEVGAEVRRRCWEDFTSRLSDDSPGGRAAPGDGPGTRAAPGDQKEPYGFSRREAEGVSRSSPSHLRAQTRSYS